MTECLQLALRHAHRFHANVKDCEKFSLMKRKTVCDYCPRRMLLIDKVPDETAYAMHFLDYHYDNEEAMNRLLSG